MLSSPRGRDKLLEHCAAEPGPKLPIVRVRRERHEVPHRGDTGYARHNFEQSRPYRPIRSFGRAVA